MIKIDKWNNSILWWLNLVNEIILYYDAQSKKYQIPSEVKTLKPSGLFVSGKFKELFTSFRLSVLKQCPKLLSQPAGAKWVYKQGIAGIDIV